MTVLILFSISSQALNKIKANVWAHSHHLVNLHPFTRVPFAQNILKVKDVIESGDFFYHPRHRIFDAMPACWKKLTEAQRREVGTLISSFYDESWIDPSKDPWSLMNLKSFLKLGFVTLDNVPKFRAAFLATRGDDSIFCNPPINPPVDDTAANSNTQSFLDQHNSFTLKPSKAVLSLSV